ncbi:MAG: M28 family peptidase [Myxococcota bacterium]
MQRPLPMALAVLAVVSCSSEVPPAAPEPAPTSATGSTSPLRRDRPVALQAAQREVRGALSAYGSIAQAVPHLDARWTRTTLTALAHDTMEGRRAGTEGIARARAQIVGALDQMEGVEPLDGVSWTLSWEGKHGPGKGVRTYHNIAALYRGQERPDEVVVVGAHYDHIGMSKRRRRQGKADWIYNGADDNASGTTAVLAMARALARGKVTLRRSVVWVWFTAEEQGLYGSQAWVDQPPIKLDRVRAMVNLDMVGRNPDRPVLLFAEPSDRFLTAITAARGFALGTRIQVEDGLGAIEDRSDQQPFADRGIPVVVLHSDVHPDYHKVTDHAEAIAWKPLQGRIQWTLGLVVALANAP